MKETDKHPDQMESDSSRAYGCTQNCVCLG